MLLRTQSLCFIVTTLAVFIEAGVKQVTKANFEENTKGKKFILLYVTQPEGKCASCSNLFPEFLATAELFATNTDILFGRVSDNKLIEVLEVTTFPSVVYYEHGSASHEGLTGDISIDNLVDTIKSGMRGDFSYIKPQYTIDLNDAMFEEVIVNPYQYAFVIIYDKDSITSSEKELQIIEDLAATFKNDETLLIGRINASKEIKLAGDFAVKRYPAFYWYDKTDKSVRKRYGGRMDVDELITFVNDQTHLDRALGGELMETAGRVPALDTLVAMYINNIMDAKDLDAAIIDGEKYAKNARYNKDYADYYVTLLKVIEKAGKVEALDEERDSIIKQLTRGGLSPREKDDVNRKKNIMYKFVDEMAMMLIGGDAGDINILRDSRNHNNAEFVPIDLHEEL